MKKYKPIYDFFDLEGYFPDYRTDKQAAVQLKVAFEKMGYKFSIREGRARFTKNNKTYIGQGATVYDSISDAVLLILGTKNEN